MADQIIAGIGAQFTKYGATGAADILVFISKTFLGGDQGMCVFSSNIDLVATGGLIILPNGAVFDPNQVYDAPTNVRDIVINAAVISNTSSYASNEAYIDSEFKRISGMCGVYGQLLIQSSNGTYSSWLGRILGVSTVANKDTYFWQSKSSRPAFRYQPFTLRFGVKSFVYTA